MFSGKCIKTLFIDDLTIYHNSVINIFTLIPIFFEKNITTLSKKSELSIVDSYVNFFLTENGRKGNNFKSSKLVKNIFLLFVETESLSHLSHC